MITPLQILLFYTKSKYMHIFIFTLLYLQRIKPLQYINPPIIVCLPKRNGGLHPAAHFCVYVICVTTNNGVLIKYITHNAFIIYKPIFALYFLKSPYDFPSWRRYTFLRVRKRNHRFLFRASEKPVNNTMFIYF